MSLCTADTCLNEGKATRATIADKSRCVPYVELKNARRSVGARKRGNLSICASRNLDVEEQKTGEVRVVHLR